MLGRRYFSEAGSQGEFFYSSNTLSAWNTNTVTRARAPDVTLREEKQSQLISITLTSLLELREYTYERVQTEQTIPLKDV